MEKTIATCQQLVAICDTNQHPLFPSLAVAAHCFYARPFKNSKAVGRLSDEFLLPKQIGIHKWIMAFRDGVFSHIDASESRIAGRAMHDVVYSNDGNDQMFSTSDPLPRPSAYSKVSAQAKLVREVLVKRVSVFHETHGDLIPDDDGHFLLSLSTATPLFVPYTAPQQSIALHYE